MTGSVLTPWVAASRLPLEEAPGAGEAEAATGAVEVTGVTEVTVTEGAVATAVATAMEGTEGEGEDSLQHSIVAVAEAAEVEAGIAAVVVAAEAIER